MECFVVVVVVCAHFTVALYSLFEALRTCMDLLPTDTISIDRSSHHWVDYDTFVPAPV